MYEVNGGRGEERCSDCDSKHTVVPSFWMMLEPSRQHPLGPLRHLSPDTNIQFLVALMGRAGQARAAASATRPAQNRPPYRYDDNLDKGPNSHTTTILQCLARALCATWTRTEPILSHGTTKGHQDPNIALQRAVHKCTQSSRQMPQAPHRPTRFRTDIVDRAVLETHVGQLGGHETPEWAEQEGRSSWREGQLPIFSSTWIWERLSRLLVLRGKAFLTGLSPQSWTQC